MAPEPGSLRNAFLAGPTVYLRALERADAPTLVPWVNDPEVTRLLLMHRPMNLACEEEFIDNAYRSEHEIALGIVAIATGRLIGTTGLRQIDFRNRHATFGIVIGEKSEWDKGYGTEATRLVIGYAFETLNLNRVELHVHESNARGIRSYEKVGFRKEGVLRQESYRMGRYWDTIVMAILRDDWQPEQGGA
jgi:RimJ/RimL family protein N-acetyltransferase